MNMKSKLIITPTEPRRGKTMHTTNTAVKTLSSMLAFTVFFSGISSATAATFNISQKPLILNETVAPNLILTLDDSGSMRWAFVPDSINGLHSTRRAKSADFNPMYYNPSVTYRIPKRYDSNGNVSETPYSTSFTAAYNNGFSNSRGTYNLSNDYRVTWTYDPKGTLPSNTAYGYSSTANRFASNPAPDFYFSSGSFTGPTTNGASLTRTINNVTFTVTRTNTGSGCTASIESPTGFTAVNCTRSSNSFSVTTNDSRQTGVPAYYYLFDNTLPSCTSVVTNQKSDDNCYRRVIVSATSGLPRPDDSAAGLDERQNFAIWYSFYRNRALATLSAAQIAFADLPSEVRLTWQSLGNCTNFNGTSSACKDNRLREYSNTHKGQLFSWLQDPPFDQSTPLRIALQRAGEFLKNPIAWQKYPNNSSQTNNAGNTYACRPSYHIMMTDGIWNGGYNAPSDTLRADHSSFILPDGNSYNGSRAPFADQTQQTLADLAMHYWATDLNPSLPNGLSPYIPFKNEIAATQYWDPRNNPATWQHMVNFTMGLGLTSALTQSDLEWDPEKGTFGGTGYKNLSNGSKNWPAAGSDSVNNVYDLWHAAINSRGEFFSVDSPDAMVQAFKDILNRIADRTTTAARPAVSAAFVADNINQLQSRVYATQFSSEDWSGEVTKTTVNKLGMVIPGEGWSTRTANANLDPTQRKVLIKDIGMSANNLKSFSWNNLTSSQKAALNINPESLVSASDGRGQDRLNYIRGERSKEGMAYPDFRQRSTILGDIINSSPALVGTPTYLPHLADSIERRDRGEGYKTYGEFRLANHRSKRKEMLYVGSNGGMLHGFESATGRETFAFIPSAVIPNLNKLTGQNYAGGEHHYFVDGSPVVRDVYFDNTDGWRTILVGTLRAGGKALFALDITDPGNIKLLWEFDSTNDEDLGYTFAQPEIVRLHSGQWAVLQGNGYNSTNDKAALLVIDIKTGELLRKIVVPKVVDDEKATLSNGLSSVRAADNNGDGLADYAYAGDLQGNIWRFDLVPSTTAEYGPNDDPFYRGQNELENFTAADIKLAYGQKPLFVAKDNMGKRQAITIQPSLVRHPSNLGYLVLVGTGKYFENSDANVDKSRAMTLYGIWDRKTRRQSTEYDDYAQKNRVRANLQKQEFITQQDSEKFGEEGKEVVNDIRLLSQNTVQWYKDPEDLGGSVDPSKDEHVEKWGWRLDLAIEETDEETWDDSLERNGKQTLAGEMVINNMAARGNTLLLSTLTPNDDPCQAGAITWFYGVNAYTGGRTPKNILDLNNDRAFNGLDKFSGRVVSGRRFNAPGGFTMSPGGVFGEGGQPPMTLPDVIGAPRQSWHIIPEDFQ